jgi:hypothetical protein
MKQALTETERKVVEILTNYEVDLLLVSPHNEQAA